MDCVSEVVAQGLCIGCGACAVLAPKGAVEMAVSAGGFIEPKVHDAAALEAIRDDFERVCPGRRVIGAHRRESLVWGPVRTFAGGHATDPRIRHAGSSGGVLTALCRFLLDTGRVDAVATLGTDESAPLRPTGRLIRDPEDLLGTAGSRYCPSSPVALLDDVGDGERVAFVGKPCDIAAVRGLLATRPDLRTSVAVLLSFFCAGVPSYDATDDLVRALGQDPATVTGFRYRGNGWPGAATATTGDRVATMSYDDSWGGHLAGRRHERCKICPDGTGELADISCGDAWNVVDGQPSFAEAEGRSVILARTPLGAAIVQAAVTGGYVALDPYEAKDLELAQPYQVERKRTVAARLVGRRLMGAGVPRYRRLGLLRSATRSSPRALSAAVKGSALRARRDHPRRWHRFLGRR